MLVRVAIIPWPSFTVLRLLFALPVLRIIFHTWSMPHPPSLAFHPSLLPCPLFLSCMYAYQVKVTRRDIQQVSPWLAPLLPKQFALPEIENDLRDVQCDGKDGRDDKHGCCGQGVPPPPSYFTSTSQGSRRAGKG